MENRCLRSKIFWTEKNKRITVKGDDKHTQKEKREKEKIARKCKFRRVKYQKRLRRSKAKEIRETLRDRISARKGDTFSFSFYRECRKLEIWTDSFPKFWHQYVTWFTITYYYYYSIPTICHCNSIARNPLESLRTVHYRLSWVSKYKNRPSKRVKMVENILN